MFASPHEMYLEETRSFRMERQDYIDEAIEQYKTDAICRISQIVDMFYVEAIALTIASGYENEDESAIEIVNRLSLNDKHIAAILGDSDQMELILNDEAIEDARYERSLQIEGDY
jgi:hypothetical protein